MLSLSHSLPHSRCNPRMILIWPRSEWIRAGKAGGPHRLRGRNVWARMAWVRERASRELAGYYAAIEKRASTQLSRIVACRS